MSLENSQNYEICFANFVKLSKEKNGLSMATPQKIIDRYLLHAQIRMLIFLILIKSSKIDSFLVFVKF